MFYFVFQGTFQLQAPRGLYSEGRYVRYEFEGLIFGGAYTEFYGIAVWLYLVFESLLVRLL